MGDRDICTEEMGDRDISKGAMDDKVKERREAALQATDADFSRNNLLFTENK